MENGLEMRQALSAKKASAHGVVHCVTLGLKGVGAKEASAHGVVQYVLFGPEAEEAQQQRAASTVVQGEDSTVQSQGRLLGAKLTEGPAVT